MAIALGADWEEISVDEAQFQDWYKKHASKWNLNPDPDDPQHHYDYRSAWKAGAEPDESGQWPNRFKKGDQPDVSADKMTTKASKPALGDDWEEIPEAEAVKQLKPAKQKDPWLSRPETDWRGLPRIQRSYVDEFGNPIEEDTGEEDQKFRKFTVGREPETEIPAKPDLREPSPVEKEGPALEMASAQEPALGPDWEEIDEEEYLRSQKIPSLRQDKRSWWDRMTTGKREKMDPAEIAEAQIKIEAETVKMTPEKYKQKVFPEGSFKREMEQYGADVLAGALGTAEGAAGFIQWMTNSKAGTDFANRAKLWREDLLPEDPTFVDDVMSGIGSMATFWIPGMGAARGAKVLAAVSKKAAAWFGASIMAITEAATEAGTVYRDRLRETGGDVNAAEASATDTFWLNLPLLLITDKLGFFGEKGGLIRRKLIAGLTESTQEGGQEIISTKASREDLKWKNVIRSWGVGGIIGLIFGGGTGSKSKGKDDSSKGKGGQPPDAGGPVPPEMKDRMYKELSKALADGKTKDGTTFTVEQAEQLKQTEGIKETELEKVVDEVIAEYKKAAAIAGLKTGTARKGPRTAKESATVLEGQALSEEEIGQRPPSPFAKSAEESARVFEEQAGEPAKVRAKAEAEPLINKFLKRTPEEEKGRGSATLIEGKPRPKEDEMIVTGEGEGIPEKKDLLRGMTKKQAQEAAKLVEPIIQNAASMAERIEMSVQAMKEHPELKHILSGVISGEISSGEDIKTAIAQLPEKMEDTDEKTTASEAQEETISIEDISEHGGKEPGKTGEEKKEEKPFELPPHSVVKRKSAAYGTQYIATAKEGPHKGVIGTSPHSKEDAVKDLEKAIKEREKNGIGTEPQKYTGPERRKDEERRKRIEDLTPEEMREELLTDELTGLGNRRAYEESEKLPAQCSIDMDSLKAVNDMFGHEAGDEFLKIMGKALGSSGYRAYHMSGDEFIVQGKTEAEIDEAIEAAQAYLRENPIQIEANGEKITIPINFSYGKGETLEKADEKLREHKQEREAKGERAGRGEEPKGILREPAEGGESSDRGEEVPEKDIEAEKGYIGVNQAGNKVYEHEDGHRYYVENGIILESPRGFHPAGKVSPDTPEQLFDKDRLEYLTKEEVETFKKAKGKPAAPATSGTLADYGLKIKKTRTKNGNTVWEVTGENTKKYKDYLKAAGAKWYKFKKAWSFYQEEDPTAKILDVLPPTEDKAKTEPEITGKPPADETIPKKPPGKEAPPEKKVKPKKADYPVFVDEDGKEYTCYLHGVSMKTGWEWYATEPVRGDIAYGYVDAEFQEWGSFSISELRENRVSIEANPKNLHTIMPPRGWTKKETKVEKPKAEPIKFNIGDIVRPKKGSGLSEKNGGRITHISRHADGTEWIKTENTGNMHFSESDWELVSKEGEEKPAAEMSADELLAEWDRQVEAQAEKETTKQPEKIPAPPPKAGNIPPGPRPGLEAQPGPTLADKAKETKEHISNAIDAFKQINEILGEKGAIGHDVDEKKWELIRPLLKQAWNEILAAGKSGAEFVALAMKNLSPKGRPYFERFVKEEISKGKEKHPAVEIADRVVEKLASGKEKITAQDLFQWADAAYGGTQAEGRYTPKDAYDALELGVNRFIMDQKIGKFTKDPDIEMVKGDIAALKAIVDRLPTHSKRTEEMDEYQQFSTPPHLSYIANWVANIKSGDYYLEPSAGIGGLAIFGKIAGANVTVNELSHRRGELLAQLGFDTHTAEDAVQINNISYMKDIKPTVVVMNPPFSATAGRKKGARDTREGAQHVEAALKKLQPNGRLVAIVGRGMAHGTPTFKEWWEDIESKYNVRADVGISGKEYQKYGTMFDNRLLIIDKTRSTTGEVLTGEFEKVEDLPDALKEVRDGRIHPGKRAADQSAGEKTPAEGENGGRGSKFPLLPGGGPLGSGIGPGDESLAGAHGTPGSLDDSQIQGGGHGIPGGGKRPHGSGGTGGIDRGSSGVGRDDLGTAPQPPDSDSTGISPAPGSSRELQISIKDKEAAGGELSDSIYEGYRPERLNIPNAKRHPTPLVQSAAMSAVTPLAPTYKPSLPVSSIENGAISDIQLESVVYAGQAHDEMLPDDRFRKGYFIGDGTGVGKGREIAAVFWDNWNKGRKKGVWISEKASLFEDAKRDVDGVGWNSEHVFAQNKIKALANIQNAEGLLFTTYDTLKSAPRQQGAQSRLDQIVEWLGEEFDGVIAFDESHNMGNAIEVRAERGRKPPSQKALAGIELQQRLPNARVLYVSATGATEVINLAYCDRLGLWGEGTSFASKHVFISEISSGGMAAMELVARDMKALGVYNARSLSYDGVEYDRLEHPLSEQQVEQYNRIAEGWQVVLRNINNSLQLTNADSNAKAAAMSAFWGAHQRFFNQIITAMQLPSVLKAMREDLNNGYSVVVQLTNTLEASQERAMAKLAEEDSLEDLDLSPFDTLMQLIEHGFPTQQYEEYIDDNGNVRTRPVFDSLGNPVENADAVAMREDLLNEMGGLRREVADNPLDQIIEEFGVKNVAEITGRRRRVIRAENEHGVEERVIDKRSRSKSTADADAFMQGKKKVLVFSEAGGTGRSYHADLNCDNQDRRIHYLLQPGWRADKAVQGLGRTHRSNQKQPPKYILCTTNLKGQKRFLSSIARRLDQLGALTKGQRQTGSQGLLQARDNLESDYARDALRNFFVDLVHGDIEGMTVAEFQDQTGLRIVDEHGNLIQQLPPIRQFLNRLLSLNVDTMDKVFDEFSIRMDEIIDAHVRAGTLDQGLETLKADGVEKAREEVVYTEPGTGAETKYVHLKVSQRIQLLDYASAEADEGIDGFYKNIKSGRVWAARQRVVTNRRTGIPEDVYHLTSCTRTRQLLTSDELKPERYEKLTKQEAERLWNEAIKDAPTSITHDEHLITGSLLPIWNRLRGHARIMRVQTDEGERMIGRIIPRAELESTLANLGASASTTNITAAEVHTNVLDHNYSIRLANDWKIIRRKVSGEQRIEMKGPSYREFDLLSKYGVFMERINYEARYFIPTSSSGIATIESIIKNAPIVQADPPVTSAQQPDDIMHQVAGSGENPLPAITRENLSLAFEGAYVAPHGAEGEFKVNLPNGAHVLVEKTGRLTVSQKWLHQYRPDLEGKEAPISRGGYSSKRRTIYITDLSGQDTTDHEAFHAAQDMVLTEREMRSLFRDYGDLEAQATAYEKWVADERRKPHTIFQKILDFFRRIQEIFFPTGKGAFAKVASGEVWKRPARPAQGEGMPLFQIEEPKSGAEAFLKQLIQDNPEFKEFKTKITQSVKDTIEEEITAKKGEGLLDGFRNRFGKGYIEEKDVTIFHKAFSLPYWLAKKFPLLKSFVDTEIDAHEMRSKILFTDYDGDLGRIQDELPKDKETYQGFKDLLWKWEGKRFPENEVPTDVFQTAKKGEDIGINQEHYDEVKTFLEKEGENEKVVDAFLAIRRLLDAKLVDIDRTLRSNQMDPDLITEYRENIGKIHNYFPHRRTGDSHVTVLDKKGDVVYREHYSTFKDRLLPIEKKARARAEKWLLKNKGTLEGYRFEQGAVTQLPDEVFFQIPVEAMQQLVSVAGREMEQARAKYEAQRLYNKEAASTYEEALELAQKRLHADMEAALSKAVAEVFKSRGWGRHAIHRKGTPGHETEDVFGILFDYLSGYAGFKTKIVRAKAHNNSLKKIKAKKNPGLYSYASRYVRDVLANQNRVDRVVDSLRGLMFVKYLGFVVKSGLVNLTQNVVMAAPMLSMHTKGILKAERMIGKAMVDVRKSLTSKAAWTGKEVRYSSLKENEQKAIRQIIEEGAAMDLYLRELKGNIPGQGMGKFAKKFVDKSGIFMMLAERMNRTSTGLAAYRVGIEKGMGHDEAVEFAKQIIYDSHFLYGQANYPELMRGGDLQKVIRSGYVFRSFTHNYIGAMSHLLTNQGREGKIAFCRSLRNLFLTGGLKSMPFFAAFAQALMWALGDDDKDALTEIRALTPAEWAKDLITYGLPGVAGVDLTGSLSIEVPRNWIDIIGVPYAFYEDTINMMDSWRAGQKWRAASETPFNLIALRNAMRGVELYSTGQTTRSGRDINYYGETGPRTITGFEAFKKGALGLQPVSVSKGYDAYSAIRKMEDSLSKKKTSWANRYVNAKRSGNLREMRKVAAEIDEWNRKAKKEGEPQRIIDIKSAVKYRERPAASQVPKSMRGAAQEITGAWGSKSDKKRTLRGAYQTIK